MSFIRTGDFVTHYELSGKEGASFLVMGNSLGTSFHMWDNQMPALRQRFRILRYDKRGHGLTQAPAGVDAYSIDMLARDVLTLVDLLKIDTFHYCGLSIGGMIGQKLGAIAPQRVLSLALCHTAMRMSAAAPIYRERAVTVRRDGIESQSERIIQRWFTAEFRARNPDATAGYRIMMERNSRAGYAGCCLALAGMELEADAKQVKCPTLVISGLKDEATPPEAGRALAAVIPGAKLVELPHAAHISPPENPAEITAALTEFFDAVLAAKG